MQRNGPNSPQQWVILLELQLIRINDPRVIIEPCDVKNESGDVPGHHKVDNARHEQVQTQHVAVGKVHFSGKELSDHLVKGSGASVYLCLEHEHEREIREHACHEEHEHAGDKPELRDVVGQREDACPAGHSDEEEDGGTETAWLHGREKSFETAFLASGLELGDHFGGRV